VAEGKGKRVDHAIWGHATRHATYFVHAWLSFAADSARIIAKQDCFSKQESFL
jgi:hypothetical protein